jgi:hypothetical protein
MRKIPHPVERKILQPLIDSDHEVMLPLQNIISAWLENKETDSMVALIKDWIDDLQDMYNNSERVDDLEYRLNLIEQCSTDADSMISEIRGIANVS